MVRCALHTLPRYRLTPSHWSSGSTDDAIEDNKCTNTHTHTHTHTHTRKRFHVFRTRTGWRIFIGQPVSAGDPRKDRTQRHGSTHIHTCTHLSASALLTAARSSWFSSRAALERSFSKRSLALWRLSRSLPSASSFSCMCTPQKKQKVTHDTAGCHKVLLQTHHKSILPDSCPAGRKSNPDRPWVFVTSPYVVSTILFARGQKKRVHPLPGAQHHTYDTTRYSTRRTIRVGCMRKSRPVSKRIQAKAQNVRHHNLCCNHYFSSISK